MATIDPDIDKVASTDGLCIIIDKFEEKHLKKASLLRTEKERHDLSFVIEMNKDVSIMKMQHMFGSMNYDVHLVNGPKPLTAMKKILQDNHNTDYTWLVVLIVGSGEHVRDEDINPRNSRYKHFWKQLSGEAFYKTPKLLIEHLVTTDQDDSHTTSGVTTFPNQNFVFVCSRIEISGLPPKSDLREWMFIDELNDVCSRYAHKRDVIALLTLIKQRLDIQMYNKEKTNIDGGEKKGYVSQCVTFCTGFNTSGIPNIAIDTKYLHLNRNSYGIQTYKMVSFSSGQQTSEVWRGLCVVLDLVTQENGWTILQTEIDNVCSVFDDLNYEVTIVPTNSVKGIQDELQTVDMLPEHDPVVFILFVKQSTAKTTELHATMHEYVNTFDSWVELCDPKKHTILIQHQLDKDLKDKSDPPGDADHIIHRNKMCITSTMSGEEKNIKKTKSLFLESLVDVLKNFGDVYNILELITQVTYEVELKQCQMKDGEKNEVFQNVIFNITSQPTESALENAEKTPWDLMFTSGPVQYSKTKPSQVENRITNVTVLMKKLQFQVMADLKDKYRYKMTKNPRGYCIIINMSNNRAGARVDEVRMKNLFEELMFDVKIIRNERHAEINKRLTELASGISSDHQSLVVFLMAHGGKRDNVHVFGDVEGNAEPSSYIFSAFDGQNCVPLINVPKLFIIQTCMGVSHMKGVGIQGSRVISADSEHERIDFYQADTPPTRDGGSSKKYAAHAMSDTCIYHATLFGHESYRNPLKGSYMIQAIDKTFREHCAEKDVQNLLNMVSGNVAKDPVTRDKELHKWQQPAIRDGALNKALLFNPGFQECYQATNYNIDAKTLCFNGNTIWFTYENKSCMVVDALTSDIREVYLAAHLTTTRFRSGEAANFGYIRSGVALGAAKHIFLVEAFTGKTFKEKDTFACIVIFDASTKTWKAETKLTFSNLISICEVYRDGVGFLSKDSEGGHMLSIYSRDAIAPGKSRARVHLQHGPSSTKDLLSVVDDSILFFNYTESVIVECELDGHVTRRKECHLSSSMRSIEAGTLYKPCVVTKDNNGDIVVVCYTGIHTNVNGAWSVDIKHRGIQHVCYNSEYTVFALEEQIDTSTAPLVPVTQYGVKPANRVVKLTEQYWRIWYTSASGVVAVGGKYRTSVTLISKDGVLIHNQNLGMPGRINSGLCLHGTHHGIIVKHTNNNTVTLAIVDHVSKTITITGELFDIDNPVSLLNINQELFGVLCYAGHNRQSCIRVLDRTTYELTKIITLGFDIIGDNDTACMDSEGFFYVCSYQNNCVRMYDQQGILIHRLGSKAKENNADIPGEWLNPCTVLVDREHCLLVQCSDGSVHRYKQNTWEILPRYLDDTSSILYHGREIYSVDNNSLCVNNIVEQEHTPENNIDVSAAACPVITGAPKHVSTTQLSRHYLRVWSDGEYLIAGGDKHTTLNILTADCETLHKHKLCDTTEADYIDSGAHIRGNLHAVIVNKIGSVDTFKLHLVHIDPRRRQIKIIRRQLDVIKPMRVVSMDSARFAVLGCGRTGEPYYISVYNKDDLSEINHINICYGEGTNADCITPSPAGGWCVSSYLRHCVYKFTGDGVNTGTVATAARDERDVRPGFIWKPEHIHHDSQGALVVVCFEGQIHRKPRNKDWEIVADIDAVAGIGVWDVCYLGDSLYVVYDDKLVKLKLPNATSS